MDIDNTFTIASEDFNSNENKLARNAVTAKN